MNRDEKRQFYFKWLDTPKNDREIRYRTGIARQLETTTATLYNWEKNRVSKPVAKEDVIDFLANFDSIQLKAFMKQVYDRAMEGKASAKNMELFARLSGMLVEKTESKVEINFGADEIAKLNTEAERRTREFRENNRMEGLQTRPPVLLGEVREDKRRREGDNPISDVAISGESA